MNGHQGLKPTDVVGPPTDVVGPPTDVVGPPTDVVGPPTDVVGPPTDVVGPPPKPHGHSSLLGRARSGERGMLAFSRHAHGFSLRKRTRILSALCTCRRIALPAFSA